jgi:hypothetical protein
MLTRNLRPLLAASLKPRQFIGHIKNMNEENIRVEAQTQLDQAQWILKTDRVYKPTYTIEFNREGEVLIYSGNPIRDSTIYFKYPYIFCTTNLTQTNLSFLSPASTTS